MYRHVDTADCRAVAREVQSLYLAMFPAGNPLFVSRTFGWAIDCFSGHRAGYQAIDAPYHDLEHTMQGTLCMARLLHGRHSAGAAPLLTQALCELGLVAILLHDTGYLKRNDDTSGTGAKYTYVHVERSAGFARQLLLEKGYPEKTVRTVQHMIRCTGVNVNLTDIPFDSPLERIVGYALGTADLLGQMAADDYVQKLPELFREFDESARFQPDKAAPTGTFSSAEDLLAKTPLFWEKCVLPKLKENYQGLFRYLNDPYPDGPNHYMERIEANIARLRNQSNP